MRVNIPAAKTAPAAAKFRRVRRQRVDFDFDSRSDFASEFASGFASGSLAIPTSSFRRASAKRSTLPASKDNLLLVSSAHEGENAVWAYPNRSNICGMVNTNGEGIVRVRLSLCAAADAQDFYSADDTPFFGQEREAHRWELGELRVQT